jgi:HEAT repeat protein
LEGLNDQNPRVRDQAIKEISEYRNPIVVSRLIDLAQHDPDLQVRCAAISGLGDFVYREESLVCDTEPSVDSILTDDQDLTDFGRVCRFLLTVYQDQDRPLEERRQAVESLSYLSSDTVERLIADLYARSEKEAKCSALLAMGRNGSTRWVEVMRQEIHSPDHELQLAAIDAAGEMGLESFGKDLWRLTYSEDKEIMLTALWSLGQTGWDGAFERLDELTLHKDPEVRQIADEAMEEWLFYNGFASECSRGDSAGDLEEE